MPILTERTKWERPRAAKEKLTPLMWLEQRNVRLAILFLRATYGSGPKLAAALGVHWKSIRNVTGERGYAPTLRVALPVARLAGVPLEDVLSGRWPPKCRWCGQTLPPTRAYRAPKR